MPGQHPAHLAEDLDHLGHELVGHGFEADLAIHSVIAKAPRHQYGGDVTTQSTDSSGICRSTSSTSPTTTVLIISPIDFTTGFLV